MPQLLYYIDIDKSTKMLSTMPVDGSTNSLTDADIFLNDNHEDIDFGTLDVFTCPCSCDSGLAFVEEQVFVIPPPTAVMKSTL